MIIVDKVFKEETNVEHLQNSSSTKIWYYQCDLTQSVDKLEFVFKQIFEKFLEVDILINGAGICNDQKIAETVQINLLGVINATNIIFDYWDKQKGGKGGLIINIASAAALSPVGPIPVYCATKSAVLTFSKSLAVRFWF